MTFRSGDEPPAPHRDTRHRVAAWTVLGLTATLTVAAVATWCAVLPPMTTTQLFSLVDLMDGVIYGGVAWLILGRRAHLAGWIVAAAALGGSLAAFAAQWTLLAERHPQWWAPAALTSAHHWAWLPGLYGLVVLMPWLLPDRPMRRGARVAVAAGVLYLACAQVAALTAPAPYGLFPISDSGLRELRVDLFGPIMPALVPLGLIAAAGAAWRWRTGPPGQRHGMGWLTVGNLLLCLAFLLVSPPWWPGFGPAWAAPSLMLASQAFFPAAVLVVVLRQRLWGIEVAVRRTLVWLLMTAGVIATYIGAVTLLDRWVPAGSLAPKIVVTALLAAAFQPVRQWVQRRVDRLVHGDSQEPLMRQVVHRLRDADSGGQLIENVALAIATSLRLARITITVTDRSGAGSAPTAYTGCPGDHQPTPTGAGQLTVDLVSGQRTVGRLTAWPRPGERLGGHAAAALADLSPVVAAVVDLASTNEALARSRARLAEARDEERRTLRRDLHDGLGPALSGIGLGLAAVRNLLHRDVTMAGELLDRLVVETTERAEEVRDLARDLMPPVLADGDLIPALHTLRERYAVAGLDIRVAAPAQLGPLPDTMATAAYGVITEAVRNVHRHAGVGVCTVTLVHRPDRVRITVADDGCGPPPPTRSRGVGLQSMRERAAGIGGTLTIGPTSTAGRPQGTAVTLTIPTPGAGT
ncbi:sensor histidine kinase [Micromonospora sp. NBC_00421]|uniref:sensor histidine kinase n=1 Tax=Micromonospora sp. NBC_00421 TaxID=2975976 RepID=UPI002E1C4774